jgi:type IV secretory pathway VirB4 component
MLPGQLLTALDDAEQSAVTQMRQNLQRRLKSQEQGSAFVTLRELEDELHDPCGSISLEQFQKTAQEVLMAMILSTEGTRQCEMQLAYTSWNKEKDQGRLKEEHTKFKKYLERQGDDITRRREKVTVMEEATAQYLDGVMQRKSRMFWPERFMRDINMRVKKKLITNPTHSAPPKKQPEVWKHHSTRKLESLQREVSPPPEKTRGEPTFSSF